MEEQSTAEPEAGGQLLYLIENLTSLHACTTMQAVAGRFEFLGEKALAASLSVLALPDASGAYRATQSSSPRPATARDLWERLHLDELSSNTSAAAVFGQAEAHSRAFRCALAEAFPDYVAEESEDEAIIAPVSFNRELLGVGLFIAAASDLNQATAAILANHTAVAMHQLQQRDDARRLHAMDARLWVPDEDFLLTQLRREVVRARRYGREVGIALLRFESETAVRDKLGAFYTNHLLRRIGAQLNGDVRDSDTVGALDGGYAVIHTETSLSGTQLSAGRLRDAVVDMIAQRFPEAPRPEVSMTAVSYPASASTAEELVQMLTSRALQGASAAPAGDQANGAAA